MDFKWQFPELLIVGPVLFATLIFCSFLFHNWRKKVWRILGLAYSSTKLKKSFGSVRFFTKYTLLALSLLFLGLSLASLQIGGQKQKVNRKGTDVVFALDVSRSMLAEDIAPNRLDKAKLLISRTLGQLSGDRVGLIAYAGSAYPALPITTDYVSAKMALDAASPNAVPSQGTNLAAALEYAFGYFNPASPAGRFIIVFTDGEDHEELEGLELPEFPVQILFVGLGTQSGGPIPIQKTRSGTIYKKDKKGEVVITRRDEKILSTLMEEIGANYIDGNRTDEAIKLVQDFILTGEQAAISEEIAIDYEPQFQWFLFPALLFLLLYVLLPNKIGNPTKYGALILLLACSSLKAQNADTLQSSSTIKEGGAHDYYKSIKQGNKLAQEDNSSTASQEFLNATAINPEGFEGWYNLGSSLLKEGKTDEAKNALKESLRRTKSKNKKSDALYNLGDAAFDQEAYEEAVNYYKESILQNPSRTDAQYNYNRAYEKLMQQQKQQDQSESQKQEEKEDSKSDKEDSQDQNPDDNNAEEKENQQGQNKGEDESNQDQDEDPQGEPKDNQEGKEPKDGGESKGKLTPEEIKGLLEAIQRAEEKTAQKANSKKVKGKKKSGEKDW
ncbi:VWA domain-containing protein [Schleiferiaceae bacterium]|nr:VWA domain-containing protein [Schleiferiaceae bacterium]